MMMTQRSWRIFMLFGVIFVYLTGVVLLSFFSLTGGPPSAQRHIGGGVGGAAAGHYYRNGRYERRTPEVNMVAKRQPLQWCQPLRYRSAAEARLTGDAFGRTSTIQRPPLQTFPGHFVQTRSNGGGASGGGNVAAGAVDTTPLRLSHSRPHPQPAQRVGSSNDVRDSDDAAGDTSSRHQRLHQRQPDAVAVVAMRQPTTLAEASLAAVALESGASASAAATDANRKSAKAAASSDELVNGAGTTKRRMGPPIRRRTEMKQLSDSTERNLIALASFPGSGNTWLRYLLQQATGIYTGSVYKDFGLLKSGFPAENVFNSSVLVVKTHEWGQRSYEHFAKAILLVRDPDRAIQAEFNRQSGGHVGFAAPDRYKRVRGRYWQQFVANKIASWEEMNTHWAKNYTGDLQIIYYDDLVSDTEGTLRSVLEFIQFPINEEQLACAIARKEGIYRRKKRILMFDPYTLEMHQQIEERKRAVYFALGRNRF